MDGFMETGRLGTVRKRDGRGNPVNLYLLHDAFRELVSAAREVIGYA